MQTGQVSIWIPIIVGIIGLAGVIIGQLVNAWREDRRWRRDQEREEIRWKREREKEEMRLAHDSMIDLRDKRIELFASYIQSVHAVAILSKKLSSAPSIEVVKDLQVEYERLRTASDEAAQSVRIVASDKILALLKSNALVLFHGFIHRHLAPIGATEEEKVASQVKGLKEYKISQSERSARVWSFYHDLTDLVRADLGISPLK